MANRKVAITYSVGFVDSLLAKKLFVAADDAFVVLNSVSSCYDSGAKEAGLRVLAEMDIDTRIVFACGKTIGIFSMGDFKRDFTYTNDVFGGVTCVTRIFPL